LALNHRFMAVILVAFVSRTGSEHVHTREEDLAGRCWRDRSWRHEQPLRFLCGRVPVSHAGSLAPGHCHPHGLHGLRCCKAAAAGRGPALCPETPPVLPLGIPQQPGHCYFLRSIPIAPPELCFPVGDPVSGIPREVEQGADRLGSQWVPMVCPQGTGMERRCDPGTPAPGPRAGIPTGLPHLAVQDCPGRFPLCVFGSGYRHASLRAFSRWKCSAGLCSGNHFLSFFKATTIPGSWGLCTGTALWHGHPAAKPQFTSSELAAIMKDEGRLSGLCREEQGHPWIWAMAGCGG